MCLVLLITGGYNSDDQRLSSAEIFSSAGVSCHLNNMTVVRYGHASAGDTVCAGDDDDDYDDNDDATCETLDLITGVWRQSHTLKHRRRYDAMWRTPSDEMMIMGHLTEVLTDDGSSEFSSTIQYDTEYVDMCL